jgi:hypothetical protein
MRIVMRVSLLVVALALLVSSAASAQSALPTADAAKFMGVWSLALDSPQGPFVMTLTLSDKGGKVAADLTSDIAPPQEVTDVTKSGEDLVLKYQGDFQGQAFAAKITLTPQGEKLSLVFDVMDGQFMMNGVGTKK